MASIVLHSSQSKTKNLSDQQNSCRAHEAVKHPWNPILNLPPTGKGYSQDVDQLASMDDGQYDRKLAC